MFLVSSVQVDEGTKIVVLAQIIDRSLQKVPVRVDIEGHFAKDQFLQFDYQPNCLPEIDAPRPHSKWVIHLCILLTSSATVCIVMHSYE